MSFSDPTSLLISMLIGVLGFGIFLYGKKQARAPQLIVGLAMMIYPYFVPSPLLMTIIAATLIGAVVLATKLGF